MEFWEYINKIHNLLFQEVQLPVVALADCAFNYKLYFPNQVFDNNILCAGYPQGKYLHKLQMLPKY